MTRPGVTYLDVANIAQQLIASGHEPTIERIRSQLKTGSNTTIGTHLRTWRTKQDPLQQLATKEKIPEELIILLKGLWERVMAQSEVQIETIKIETKQELSQQKQMIEQLQQTNAQLQQSEVRLKHTADGLLQEKTALELIINKSQVEAAALQAKHDGLMQQLADKQTRIDELNKQNKQVQANLEHYQAASLEQRQIEQQRAEQQQRELTQTMQQLKMENDLLRHQQIELQQSHNQLQLTLANTQTELFNLNQKSETLTADLIEANQKIAQKSELQLHGQSQYDKLHVKWEEQIKLTADLQSKNAVCIQQITTLQAELIDIADQNKRLVHDKWILGQEKAQLFGQVRQLQTTL